MSEEKPSCSKRRRMEGSSSLSVAGTSSSSVAGAFSSSAANAPTVQLKKKEAVMMPEDLQILLTVSKSTNHLIIDAREPDSFEQKKINSAGCVDAPVQNINGGGSSSGDILFNSRTEVIQILENCCPNLLYHLRPPGHYSHIVILDEKSTIDECSKSVRLIYDALIKWNEGSSTFISVLEGGLAQFSEKFPNLIVTSTEPVSPNYQPDGIPVLTDILQNSEDSADLETETIEEFLCYLRDLDEMIAIIRKLITLKSKLMAFAVLEPVLYGELVDEEDKLTQTLETSIPEGGKCPVCFEIFRGEILQCTNGHSICSNCCDSLANCPECRVPYLEKVRNRALENILENSLKAKCVCGVKLEPKDVESHVLTCVKKTKTGMEIAKVEKAISATKLEMDEMNENLRQIGRVIVDTEAQWYSRLTQDLEVSPPTWKKLCAYRNAKKSTLGLLEENLFSMLSPN